MTHTKSSPRLAGNQLRRVLTHWDATALIVGIMIGSGIFATPPSVASSLDRFGPMLSVWIVGGLLALCGALTYAELSTMYPRTGGVFVFIHATYGPAPAFVYGWSALLITYPASIAAIAVVFAAYLARLVPAISNVQPYVAAGLILALAGLNILGVVLGARVQRVFTATKVAALLALVFVAIVSSVGRLSNLSPVIAAPSGGWSAAGWAVALAAVMWTYEGWAEAPTLSGEVKNIRTDVPRALILGTATVMGIYLLINTAYVYVLSIPAIAASDSVAVDMAHLTFGPYSAAFIALLVVVSTAGSVNGSVISSSRVFFAMAQEELFFRSIGRVHRRFETPANSLAIIGIVAACYCLVGTFERIMQYFVFNAMLWFTAVAVAVIVLRWRCPDAQRPFRVPFYPIPPLLFILIALGLAYQLLIQNTVDSVIGLCLLVASVPAYFLWRRLWPARGAC
jgi:APA family basic amino acid/polyamine antiporter